MKRPRYITHIGYFGPTSNVKAAPPALTGEAVARLLSALPPRREEPRK